ncbi:MAG: NUDIX-like domain-containing protein [Pseudomonadota bacterium]
MKQAEKVTFGGSGLNRSADLRENSVALADLQDHPDAQYIALWRGKLAVFGNGSALCRLSADQPVVEKARKSDPESVIFLAMLDGTLPCFAIDISAWNPEGQDTTGMNTFLDPSEQVHPQLPPGHVFAELRRIMTRLSTQDAELAATAKAIFGWHASHRFCSCCGTKSEMIHGGWQRRVSTRP